MGVSLIGVWQVQSVEYMSGSDVRIIEPALPGLFIFTDKYYSMTWMPLGKMQKDYTDLWHPTEHEKIESYNSIVTNSGQYVKSGQSLTTYVEVAKTPAFIGGKAVYSYKISEDELQMENTDNVAHDGTRDTSYLKLRTVITLKKVQTP